MSLVRLGEICDFQGGTQPPKNEWKSEPLDGYVRMLQIRDFTQGKKKHIEYVKDSKKLSKCKHDDILIGRYGASVGKILTGLEGAYNVAIIKTIPNEERLIKKYLYYFLLNPKFKSFITNIGGRAAQQGFNKDDISDYKIFLPSLSEQLHIANILSKAETLIEQRKQGIALLDEFLKSTFAEMFIDKGFPYKKLGDLSNKITDGEHKKPVYQESGMPFISVKNITNGFLDFTDCKYVTMEDFEKFTKRCKPELGDIIYTKVGATYGRASIVDTEVPFCLYVSVALIKPKKELVLPKYLQYSINHPFVKRQADKSIKGAGVPDLHLVEIKSFDIPVPPMSLQTNFVKLASTIESLKEQYKNSLQELENLYGALSQRAFKGELEVVPESQLKIKVNH